MRAIFVGTLLDGLADRPLERAVLVEDAGRVLAAGREGEVAVPEGAEVWRLPEATVMPGLIDAHVHLAYTGEAGGSGSADLAARSYPALALRAAAHARQTLEWGFTAVRDLGAPGGTVIDLGRAVGAGHVPGPRVVACGLGLSVTGGHMDQRRFGDHVSAQGLTRPCDSPEGFRQGVREQVRRGAEVIKINLCVGSRRAGGPPWRQEMIEGEVAAAIDEAHRLEKKVAAHTSGGPAIARAAELGLDSVEHGHWIDERAADLMAERGTYYVPTLLVNERNFELGGEKDYSPDAWDWLLRSREDKWVSLERVRRAGVKIGLGTDAGFMLLHGTMNARELELLVQGGLSPIEALNAATGVNAGLLDLPDRGTLRAGQVADFLLVEGRPHEDVRLLQRQDSFRVFQAGAEVTRASWEETRCLNA